MERERERIRKRGKRKYFLVKSISALFTTERFFFRNFNKRWVVVAGNKIHMKDKSTSPISSDQFLNAIDLFYLFWFKN